jgi:tRNA/rRNA methyltransferase
MAGTNRALGADERNRVLGPGPAIVLVEPQLGENIGACARAMLNAGLGDLRLVNPRDGWPNPAAEPMASGATEVLDTARVYQTTAEAVADLTLLFATTARPRDMVKDVVTPREAAARLRTHIGDGRAAGVLFGAERSGLVNEDVVLADAVLQVPLNPAFASLNLAQAVLLVGYEWFQAGDATEATYQSGGQPPATVAEREYFFGRLEEELARSGFLFPENLAPTIKRNLRNLFTRARLTDQDVRTLHGVLKSLVNPRGRAE